MKQLFIAALVAASLTTTAFASTIIGNKNCKELACVVANFENVTIQNKANFTRASITNNGNAEEIFYTPDGDFIGSTKKVAYDKLPVKAIKTISKRFLAPTYTVKDCIEFINADNNTNYYVSLDTNSEKIILEISENGNVSIFSVSKL